MIVISGAAGLTGLAILSALRARGATEVRAVVSRSASVDKVRRAGASEAVIADLRNADDVQRAYAGAQRAYHIGPMMSDQELAMGRHVIAAARSHGLRQLVFHSVVHSQSETLLHHRDKRYVEDALIDSGVPYTILKPTMYMQNLDRDWAAIRNEGAYKQPYSASSRMSMVDLHDVAEAAAIVLTQEGWERGEFELASGEILDRLQMAECIGAALGRVVRADVYTRDEWMSAVGHRLTEGQVARVLAMFADYDQHGIGGGNARVLAMILGRQPTTFRQFIARFVAEKQGGQGA